MTLVMGFTYSEALAEKPTIMKGCKNCHKSPKFSSLHVNVGPLVWIIKYDENTKLTGADSLAAVKKGKEMSVVFSGDENNPLANVISIKKPFNLPEEKLVSVDEMKKLVLAGPKKGSYQLVDSRPPAAYKSGHLPGAISIPFPKLNKMRESVLPQNKDALIIFYCGGFS
jgi:hypothetical protein